MNAKKKMSVCFFAPMFFEFVFPGRNASHAASSMLQLGLAA